MTPTRTKAPVGLNIRWMIRRDLNAVIWIDRAELFPEWSEEDFCRCLRSRNTISLVAEQGESILGYVVYSLQPGSFTILRMAVQRRYQRLGIGRKIIEKLQRKLTPHRTRIVVDVPERLLRPQLFLRRMRFFCTDVISGGAGDDDAYRMVFEA